jgi:hypothetical protein
MRHPLEVFEAHRAAIAMLVPKPQEGPKPAASARKNPPAAGHSSAT